MAEDRAQKPHVKQSSLNERERKDQIKNINKTNRLMLERLQTIAPVMSKKRFEDDFEMHKKRSAYLKKRRYGPATLKTPKTSTISDAQQSTFDAESYMTMFGGGHDSMFDSATMHSPINSMAEFRKQVISSKRMSGGSDMTKSLPKIHSNTVPTDTYGEPSGQKKEIRFEMRHEPS
jgi:hypothetical protein